MEIMKEAPIRIENFGARNGNYERNAAVKNQGTKQRVQRILGNGKPTGSVLKETNEIVGKMNLLLRHGEE